LNGGARRWLPRLRRRAAGEAPALTAEALRLRQWLGWFEPVIVASSLLFLALYAFFPVAPLLVLAVALGLIVWPLTRRGRHLADRNRVDAAIACIGAGLWVLALSVSLTGAPVFAIPPLLAMGAVIIAVPYASQRLLLRTVLVSTAVCAAAAALSLGEPVLPFAPFPESMVRGLVAGYALVVFTLYSLAVWHSKTRLSETLAEMREANRALAESERSLERKVEKRTAQLGQKNEALEESQRELALARDEAIAANRHKSSTP
jgi:type III secretory pathway component EscV